jgi:galactokinase
MDQFACVKGKSGHFILLDCRTLEHQYIPADLGAYQLLLLNTGVTHDLANSAYNRRRWACEEGVKVLASANKEIKSLRDATPDLVASVKNKMTDEVHKRCRYVVHENQRVLEAVDALKQKDMLKLGKLLFETHEGLKTDYEVSCPELDFLVSEARTFSGVAGARLVGGGFGGCTLNLIHSDAVPAFKERIISSYKNSFSSELQVISVALGTGVGQSL